MFLVFLDNFLRRQGIFVDFGALKNSLQRVVVLGGNGIELVIVALRTGGCQAEKPACRDIHTIVLKVGRQVIEAQSTNPLALVTFQKVTRDLCLHELVVRQIIVECFDHPVAITEGIGKRIFF